MGFKLGPQANTCNFTFSLRCFSLKQWLFSDDLPPPPRVNDHVKTRRNRKRRTIKTKQLEELISTATRAAHVARDKGFYIVSPEAIQCVEILRHMRTLPLNARLITKTDGLRVLLFLSKNGNPKIRSESKAVIDHWKSILHTKVH
ncbi:putative transcription factor IIS, TFIIS/LEDGF domain superfamily [Arabidopsis thaliana]